jgi:hypothetical protein
MQARVHQESWLKPTGISELVSRALTGAVSFRHGCDVPCHQFLQMPHAPVMDVRSIARERLSPQSARNRVKGRQQQVVRRIVDRQRL